jgi:Calcineurin-like phosphoesterase
MNPYSRPSGHAANWLAATAVLALSGCGINPSSAPAVQIEAIFTVRGEGQQAVVRVLTRADSCPGIAWDGKPPQAMLLRVAPATPALRSGGVQTDVKPAVFDIRTCEAVWPAGAVAGRVAGQDVPAPRSDIRRIVIIADTGCRMKASEDAFQHCNDAAKWPFAQVAQSAAALKPDLVLHIGDIHYRESPCPAGNPGCANSPWGYGFDAWQADFFRPAKPLLQAAPWVFVRGNHESCFRAGQGWFRFIDAQPWTEARSCDDAQLDAQADYSEPYAVPIAPDTQLVVFDSSKTSGKPFTSLDPAYAKYNAQMLTVNRLTKQTPQNFFTSHHPLLAFAPVDEPGNIKPGGNAGLQSVFAPLHPERLFPDAVSVAMHGHVHLFEAISFKSAHPASLVMGNSGSANEGLAPEISLDMLAAGIQPFKGAVVEDYAATSNYGFATLDRVGATAAAGDWLLTEYSASGVPVIRCKLSGGKSRCAKVEGTLR